MRYHTVTAYEKELPTNAQYFASGGFGSEQAARDGYTQGNGAINGDERYNHTFEIPGRYEYFCIPHEQVGMKGTVTVSDSSGSINGNKNTTAVQSVFDQLLGGI